MKRIALIALLASVLAPAASAAVPRLTIATSSPLVVAGTHFKANERVVVTFRETTRQVRATALGSFRASFPGIVFDRCSGFKIVAAGLRGDRAVLVQNRVMCAPASSP